MFYKDLKVTETSVKKTETIIEPDTSYNTGVRNNGLIDVTLVAGSEKTNNVATIFDGDPNTFVELDDGPQIIDLTFAEAQRIESVTAFVSKYNETMPAFKVSEDGVEWVTKGMFPAWSDNADATSSFLTLPTIDKPYKYYRIEFSENKIGKIYNIDFETTSYTEVISVTADGLATGQMDFEHSFLTDVDDSGNKKVSFNVLNNGDIETQEIFSFTGQRETVAPNFAINGFLDVSQRIWATGGFSILGENSTFSSNSKLTVNNQINASQNISSQTYLQTGNDTNGEELHGIVKFYDKDSNTPDWRDLGYFGAGVNVTEGYNPGGGLYIQNIDDSFKAIVTNENIATIIENEGISVGGESGSTIDDNSVGLTTTYSSSKIRAEIDDFDKIDTYLGAYCATNSVYFDKYIDIDTLLGRIAEADPTLTAEEIALADTLDNQLGLLSEIDNNIVEYIDLKLGMK